MAGPAPVVGIVGMRAFRRDINRMCTDVSGPMFAQIKEAGRQAAEPVAERARSVLPKSTGDHAGRLAGDVRVSGTKTGASVRMGRKTVAYAGWIEFGGSLSDAQHNATREFIPTGRYLFPSAVGVGPVAAEKYAAALSRVLNSGSVWTNTTNDPGSVHD